MNRVILSLFAASLVVGGCNLGTDDDPGSTVACMFEGVLTVSADLGASYVGESARGEMRGLCSLFEDCVGRRPIAQGERIDVTVVGIDMERGDGELNSSGPAITVASFSEDECGTSFATLEATELGSVTLSYAVDGHVVDTFPIDVAEPVSVAIDSLMLFQDDSSVLSVGTVDYLRLNVRDAEGRSLAIGRDVDWSIDDESIVEMVEGQGAMKIVQAKAPGTTVARVHFRGFDAEVTFVVK